MSIVANYNEPDGDEIEAIHSDTITDFNRIAAVESKIVSVKASLSDLVDDIAAIDEEITEINTNISTNIMNLASVSNRVSTIEDELFTESSLTPLVRNYDRIVYDIPALSIGPNYYYEWDHGFGNFRIELVSPLNTGQTFYINAATTSTSPTFQSSFTLSNCTGYMKLTEDEIKIWASNAAVIYPSITAMSEV